MTRTPLLYSANPELALSHDRIAELLLAGLPATTARFREDEQDHDRQDEQTGSHQVLLELARFTEHGL